MSLRNLGQTINELLHTDVAILAERVGILQPDIRCVWDEVKALGNNVYEVPRYNRRTQEAVKPVRCIATRYVESSEPDWDYALNYAGSFR